MAVLLGRGAAPGSVIDAAVAGVYSCTGRSENSESWTSAEQAGRKDERMRRCSPLLVAVLVLAATPAAFSRLQAGSTQNPPSAQETSPPNATGYQPIVRPKQDDPNVMTSLVPGQVLAPRASKEVQKGISDLNAGRLDDAQKHLEAAQKLATTNADLNYLLGFLYLQKKDPKRAQPYLMKAISIDSHHVRALTALGQLRLQGKDYAGAVTPLEQVV